MKEITADDLRAIVPALPKKAEAYVGPLNAAMKEVDITTPLRQAAFLAQTAHESDSFKTMREYASGKEYEGRHDLGNTHPGDGVRFKGRGFIQITGRFNYAEAEKELRLDLVDHPELAETPEVAARVAAWYWKDRNINAAADRGDAGFEKVTHLINGGLNGLASRKAFYIRAKKVFGIK